MEKLGDRQALWHCLEHRGLGEWCPALERACAATFSQDSHGKMPEWSKAWQDLPTRQQAQLQVDPKSVAVVSDSLPEADPAVRQQLMAFHPWRKGPFRFLGWDIDTEWRSDWKWNRLARHIDFSNRWVLDVGCGNGYYGWRMLEAGARMVLGCDPFLLYLMQFEVFRRYAPEASHWVVPLTDDQLPDQMQAFDITLSMGVLYHRTSPIDHLKTLWQTLRPGGTLVLETLILSENAITEVLVPEDRYAQMRNVWFIPTVPMLERWLRRCRFDSIEILDVSPTTTQEQRSTPWMTFQSLSDFLDPVDPLKTVEGYPGPVRVLLRATRKK